MLPVSFYGRTVAMLMPEFGSPLIQGGFSVSGK